MSDWPEFVQLHVISDLHMGGRPGFQILKETQRLANYIRWVSQQLPGEAVGLVLNGDVIDTLAEESGDYLRVRDAVAVLVQIMKDDHFAEVWAALASFVQTPGRALIIAIGNHDIEMAFPAVQRAVVERLCGGSAEARGRILFSTMGAGFTCRVGNSRIYCTHGNEVDPWNFNSYEAIAKIARRLSASVPIGPDDWKPNAGTRMVKDIMNGVKRKYAWVDLLKPETSVALGTLVALDPAQLKKVGQLLPLLGQQKVDGLVEVDQRLSVSPGAAQSFREGPSPQRPDELLGPQLRALMGESPNRGDELMLAVETRRAQGKAVARSREDSTLGVGGYFVDRVVAALTGAGPEEALRRALLDGLKGDSTFDMDKPDETYDAMVQHVGADVGFVVTGHTHLERALPMSGGRYYFNTGTWIRLMQMKPEWLKDTASFKPVYQVLASGSMEALDKGLGKNRPLLLDCTSAVMFSVEKGKTWGRLVHVEGNGTQAPRMVREYGRA